MVLEYWFIFDREQLFKDQKTVSLKQIVAMHLCYSAVFLALKGIVQGIIIA